MANPLVALSVQGAKPVTAYAQGQQTANQNRLSQLRMAGAEQKLQANQQQMQQQNRLQELLPKATAGDQGAMQEISTIDYDLFSKLDERQRTQLKEMTNKSARLLGWVESQPQERKQQAYQMARQRAISMGYPEDQIPQQYDPNWVGAQVAEAREIEDLLAKPEQSAFAEKLELYKNDPAAREMIEGSSPRTEVNVNAAGAEKEAEKLAETRVGRYDQYQQEAIAALDENAQLGQLKDIDVETGFGEDFKAQTARIMDGIGISGADELLGANVTNVQSYNAVAGRLLASYLAKQKGPQTDQDARRIEKTLPNIGNDELANEFIIDSLRAVNKRKIERADFYREFLQSNRTLEGADQAWYEARKDVPMVSDTVKDPQTGLPMFFYDFQEKFLERNPDASESDAIDQWRQLTKG